MAKKKSSPANRANGKTATNGKSSANGPLLERSKSWTFLTNHSHVLILLHRNPDMVLREVATRVGITERAVQRIVQDLEEDGFVSRERVGRQNHYEVATNKALRHPIEEHCRIGDLLDLVVD